ncbi:MAG: hypothetical protein GY784_13080 [Gammaproteobacteria bacterium]|nr:hypothetical protein [Gammaproteobacteria bacterium]
MTRFVFRYLIDEPIVDIHQWPQLEGNANGPSLIGVPGWVKKPLARYYLYFAHHEGKSIRLAYADNLAGPWILNKKPALTLEDSLFIETAPDESGLDEQVKQDIANGVDGDYPHIASPDVVTDEASQKVRLYYHGRLPNGRQVTRVAISTDGLNFAARPEILGPPYFRVFKQKKYYYAIVMPGILHRSKDGLTSFERGPLLTRQAIRHAAVLKHKGNWYVFWSRVGDAPESIICSMLLNTEAGWSTWQLAQAYEIHRPRKPWEGANQPVVESRYGAIMQAANQLRDPAIYTEDGKIYLLYAIAGEQGIGIGTLTPMADD